MTKLSTLGASLLILSLAAPALADDGKSSPPKVAAAAAQAAKPVALKAKSSDVARRAEDDGRGDRKDRDEQHGKARRHDRD